QPSRSPDLYTTVGLVALPVEPFGVTSFSWRTSAFVGPGVGHEGVMAGGGQPSDGADARVALCPSEVRQELSSQAGCVVGFQLGREASKSVTSCSCRRVRPMSSSPSIRRHRV